jgi:hypothetical protein
MDINASEFLLKKGKDKKIVTIGHFPFSNPLRKVAKS